MLECRLSETLKKGQQWDTVEGETDILSLSYTWIYLHSVYAKPSNNYYFCLPAGAITKSARLSETLTRNNNWKEPSAGVNTWIRQLINLNRDILTLAFRYNYVCLNLFLVMEALLVLWNQRAQPCIKVLKVKFKAEAKAPLMWPVYSNDVCLHQKNMESESMCKKEKSLQPMVHCNCAARSQL